MGKILPSIKSRADRYLLEHGHAVSRAQARAAIEAGKVRAWAELSWPVEETMDSPIAGGSGNREYLVAARRR